MAVDQAEALRRGQAAGRSRAPLTFGREGSGAKLRGSLSDALQQYAADVQEKVLRSAVYAGAKVLADELYIRAPLGPTGNLKDAVYTFHDDKQSVGGVQVYAVGVNKVKAPHWANVEYGHWRVNVVYRGPDGKLIPTKQRLPTPVWVPAHPYLRPTAGRMPDALRAMQRRLVERLREVKTEGAAA